MENQMKNKQNLYSRAYQLTQEIITLQEDLKELKGEFSYDKEYNTDGFDKKDVSKIIKAAVAKAKADDLKTKAEELNELQEIQETYS
jgi:uncharacterized protein (UPF0335 family)